MDAVPHLQIQTDYERLIQGVIQRVLQDFDSINEQEIARRLESVGFVVLRKKYTIDYNQLRTYKEIETVSDFVRNVSKSALRPVLCGESVFIERSSGRVLTPQECGRIRRRFDELERRKPLYFEHGLAEHCDLLNDHFRVEMIGNIIQVHHGGLIPRF